MERALHHFEIDLQLNGKDNKKQFELANFLLSMGKQGKGIEMMFSIKDDPEIAQVANKLFWSYLGTDDQDKPFVKMNLDTLAVFAKKYLE